MYVLSLKPYFRQSKYALSFYNVLIDDLIKKKGIKKNDFLTSLSISPTSFRRSIKEEQNVGKDIENKLKNFFKINSISYDKLVEIEKDINDIFIKMYYKKDIFQFSSKIDEYISLNTILTPILNLFKIIIIISDYKEQKEAIEETAEFYSSIKKFKDYFTDDFDSILLLEKLLIEKDIKSIYNYSTENTGLKAMIGQALASLAFAKGEYGKALYYIKEAESCFIIDYNYIRLASMNLTKYVCLNSLGEYQKVYNLAKGQLQYFEYNDRDNLRYLGTKNHLAIACLGLGKYSEAIELFDGEKMNHNSYLILLTALFMSDKKKYKVTYKEAIINVENKQEDIENLNMFLNNPKTTYFNKLVDARINSGLLFFLSNKLNVGLKK